MERAALSPKEFAALFGKSQTWGYRQIYQGKVNKISEHGRLLIPASEVERILASAKGASQSKSKKPSAEMPLNRIMTAHAVELDNAAGGKSPAQKLRLDAMRRVPGRGK